MSSLGVWNSGASRGFAPGWADLGRQLDVADCAPYADVGDSVTMTYRLVHHAEIVALKGNSYQRRTETWAASVYV